MQENIEKYVTHPINAFLLIKRLTVDIDELYFDEIQQAIKSFKANTDELRPSTEDLVGAVDGILRLQRMYKLETEEFSNGIIDGHQSQSKLSKHDLFTIATSALQLENENFYIRKYLMKAFTVSDPFDEVTNLEILNVLVQVKQGEQIADDFERNGIYTKEKETILYSQLCRKLNVKSPAESASLKCFYDSKTKFTKIAPFKVEEADHRIGLVIFHDVISDNEIEELKQISRTNFERATVVIGNSTKTKSRVRTAKVAWFDDRHPLVEKITKRVKVSEIS